MAAAAIPPFAQLVRRYRRDRGLTQEALAEAAGLSARGIRALEQGERTAPHTDTVQLLAAALQLSADDRARFESAARHLAGGETAGGREMAPPVGSFLGARPTGALIAREGEMVQALRLVEEVERGAGRVILLAGEAGVGKTRLAQQVMFGLGDRGFRVATGRCYEPRQALPYYPFLEALTTLHASCSTSHQAQVLSRWPSLGRLLPSQRLPGPSASAPLFSMDAKEQQERLFWAVTEFVRSLTDTTSLALLFDDLHWADGSSLDLLQHVARHTRGDPILLLGTYRDVEVGRGHPLERAVRDLHRERLVERIAVQRLPPPGTAALIAATFEQEIVSEEFASLIHRHTDGNPFFTLEVLRGLVERGDIYREDGRWERREIAELSVPQSIRSASAERLSRLSEEAQDLLCEASVLGQTFCFDDLHVMAARREEEVEQALKEATQASLIGETGRDEYSFDHALTQQALYAELSGRKRRRLHLAAGGALEKLPEQLREKRAAELAWHFLQGEDQERALHWSVSAGDRAEAVFAHAEAEQQYLTALELARERGDQLREAEALEKLGKVLNNVARYDEALALLEEAAERDRQVADIKGEMRVAAEIGMAQRGRGTSKEGIAQLELMVERFEARGPSRELAVFYATLDRLYFAVGRYDDELAAAERASQLARQASDEYSLALAEAGRGTALAKLGRLRDGVRVLEEAIPLVETLGDVGWPSRVFLTLVTATFGWVSWTGAENMMSVLWDSPSGSGTRRSSLSHCPTLPSFISCWAIGRRPDNLLPGASTWPGAWSPHGGTSTLSSVGAGSS